MHGEGMLCWQDEFGVCRYKGSFEHNVFQGHGTLEWSVKARYVGEFFNGLYHGEGTFEWPDKAHVYRGHWQFGEMSGKGTLTTSCGSIYSGEFHAGQMEGRGTITFITNDQYVGEFKNSMFNGLGCYTWSTGTFLCGAFDDNVCNHVGRKTYANGVVYVGELLADMEHGRGVLSDQNGARIVGVWEGGRLSEELTEAIVPALEVEGIAAPDREQRVFVATRKPVDGSRTLANAEDGKSLVIFANGDKYVGEVRNGHKHGVGMFVYADGTAHKGHWERDEIDGCVHPRPTEHHTDDTRRLHEMNSRNIGAIANLKQKSGVERKPQASVLRLQD